MTAPSHPLLRRPDPWGAAPPPLVVGGRDLRYLLTILLHRSGPLTVARLVTLLEAEGFAVRGRPSKEISDALRWEVGRKRVVRLGRGRYAPGVMPPSTERRIHRHVLRLGRDPDDRRGLGARW